MEPRSKSPGNLQGLERWITEWARNDGLQAGRLHRRIGIIAFAAMIDAADGGETRFVFKGGAASNQSSRIAAVRFSRCRLRWLPRRARR